MTRGQALLMTIASAFSSHSSAARRPISRRCTAMGWGWLFARPSFRPTEAVFRYLTESAAGRVSVCFYRHRCDRDIWRPSTMRRIKAMTQQNILVVDDEAPMRRLLASNLRASGYAVRAAADGLEALKLLDEHPFDLLLLDINMPGP